MNMRRVQLDISNDIFGKVMFFRKFAKEQGQIEFYNILNPKNIQKKEEDLIFGDFLNHSQEVNNITKLDRNELNG